jgi:hypothetical protein
MSKWEIEKHCKNKVVIVKNFLSEEEIDFFYNFVDSFNYDALPNHDFAFWGKRLINESTNNILEVEGSMNKILPFLNIIKKRTIEVLNEFDRFALWEPSPHNLIKMYPGSDLKKFNNDDTLEMFYHIDNQDHMEQPIYWGSVVYLNNEYSGGEIIYPDYGYQYKPVPGAAVFHEGFVRHGVKKVTIGNRYCAASLISIQNEYNQNPLPARTNDPKNPYWYPPGYWGKRMMDDPIQGEVKNPRRDGSIANYNGSPVLGRADTN